MSYLEELLPEFRNGAKIRCSNWIDGIYIQKDGESIVNHNNYTAHIHAEDALSDQWEFYQEPIDWDYIIKNKCLCWFWDSDENRKCMGILNEVGEFIPNYKFINHNNVRFKNCRPVCKGEGNFYEERKDGNN